MKFLKQNIYLLFVLGVLLIFISPFILKNLFPIPSDSLVGLYHPFRDFYAKQHPRGVPFKNSLITDPVRQIIPWKFLSVEILAKGEIPLWNPYEMAGKPLLGNFQSSPFYIANIFLLAKPLIASWSIFILSQLFLAGIFMWLYLSSLRLDKRAVALGTISFCFSGFFVAWLEWGNVVHTVLWLPLILLSIDKIVVSSKYYVFSIKNKRILLWSFIYIASLISSFFAGHLQIFFYVLIFSFVYFLARCVQFNKNKNIFGLYILLNIFAIILTSIQWISTLQFISLSARNVDQSPLSNPGWFIPFQNLTQFLVPDFFGNPTTLNYWGVWNYAEFVGYIGIIPLLFSLFAIFNRKDKKTLFYSVACVTGVIFAFPSIVANIPYVLNFPLISTSQPTRLLSVICFSLSVLSALGFDVFIKTIKESYKVTLIRIYKILIVFFIIFVVLWLVGLFGNLLPLHISSENSAVIKRNLLFPTIIFAGASFCLFSFFRIKNKKVRNLIFTVLILISAFDLLRFAGKFDPFTKKEYFYPTTKTIGFLKEQKGIFRIASNDSRILPPNFSTFYKIQSVEGYDPLYLRSYAEFIAASERGKADISPPFGFNRIITPHNINSPFLNMLNIKYLLSLSEVNNPRFKKIFQEGETRIYENQNVLPRVFFVKNIIWVSSKEEAIKKMFEKNINFAETAVVEKPEDKTTPASSGLSSGSINVKEYSPNKIILETKTSSDAFLVFSDSYYPTWHVKIDNSPFINWIFKTNYAFRGVFVPKGNHRVEFYNNLFNQ